MAGQVEEIVIPKTLQNFLTEIVDNKFGYKLGAPWKFSEEALGVVVPIIRQGAPDREYVTMYEVLKDMGIKDSTGQVSQLELQNRAGKAVFVRAGTVFAGGTQPRATQHSGVYQPGKEDIPVRCVHQTHGIVRGSEMKFADIAPLSVTMNLMTGSQSSVWDSVRRYTGGDDQSGEIHGLEFDSVRDGETHYAFAPRGRSGAQSIRRSRLVSQSMAWSTSTPIGSIDTSSSGPDNTTQYRVGATMHGGTDDLLGHMQKMREGQVLLDEMMQKVPLFDYQVGAIIFNPVGVVAVETFDHPMSWEAIKKEIIEKFGDKIMDKQAEHLFELKPEAILPAFQKFIKGLEKNTEKTIRKDGFSETRVVLGEGIIGEYTLVKDQTIHVLLIRESGWGA